jgi:EAL domain-containing protein (putative c-di-GMP-specific phosphodiesterase class I)
VLKIDQGFIRDIPHNGDDMAISRAIIAMGRSLDLQVLAEGVETVQQLDFLRSNGCDAFQGYLCSKPLPAAEFAALLAGSGGTARMAGHAVQPVALTADDPGTDSL